MVHSTTRPRGERDGEGWTLDTRRWTTSERRTNAFGPCHRPLVPRIGSGYYTGLFSFNRAFKVPPSYIQNLSFGYTFYSPKNTVRVELFFTNLFDNKYLSKGAFFSGQYVGRSFKVQLKVTVAI